MYEERIETLDNAVKTKKKSRKKIPTIDDAVEFFKEVVTRASLSAYYYVGNIIISKNDNEAKIIIKSDQALWDKLITDEAWKTETKLKEIDVTIPEENSLNKFIEYGKDNEGWFPIDNIEDLYKGKLFKLKVAGFDYDININKDFMPLKLKKNEFENASYKVYHKETLILAIKKRFKSNIDDAGFDMIRLFHIV